MKGNIYLESQIRALETLAYEDHGLSPDELMARAGKAAFLSLQKHWPDANNITVVCGPGNNGGDGYVVAELAQQAGLNVKVLYLGELTKLTTTAATAKQRCVAVGVNIETFAADKLLAADVIVDAIFGIGLQREVTEGFAEAINAINNTAAAVLAIDIPSGIQADNGQVMIVAVKAHLTSTYIGYKLGLFTGAGVDYVGELELSNLEIPESAFQQIQASAKALDFHALQAQLTKRARNTFKNSFGHVLVIGGDYGFAGAVRMCAEAALRVGAGLVSIATRVEHVNSIVSARPEIMAHGITTVEQLKPLLDKATVIALGPGLGQSDWSKALFAEVLKTDKSILIDADALNILSETNARPKAPFILTPHPGEAARLLKTKTKEISNNRYQALYNLQDEYGGVCVLKGAGTLIKLPRQDMLRVCVDGNPGMATAGMGDVLSGVITGLWAQGLSAELATCLGVSAHACAGDLAVLEGGERGLIATDLLKQLRSLVNLRVTN